MKLSQVINHNHQSIFEDKVFVKQFSILLILIMATSSFLIYHSFHTVNSISTYGLKHHTTLAKVTLDNVERELNGNIVNLEIIEDDFSDLAELESKQSQTKIVSSHIPHVKDVVAKNVAPEQVKVKDVVHKTKETTSPLIQISSVEVNTHKHKNSIKSIRKKFQQTNNIKYAMELAHRFYQVKKYNSALKWALIANEINPKASKSWILFAKTKVQLGKKKDAINALQAYLKMYKSSQVLKYLQQLKS